MATKLNANVAKRVKSLGIKANSEEEARTELLKILEDNGIEQMDDEDITTLVEIAESFVDPEESETNVDEEEENDELAREVEEEEKNVKKSSAKGKKEDDDEEEVADDQDEDDEDGDDEEEDSGDEFDEMDRTELKKYIKDNELEISVKKSWSDDDIREKIREAISSDEEEDDEEEAPTPEPAPAKKANKKEEKKAQTNKRGNKLNPKNNEEDRKHFDFLKKIFPEDKYIYAWVASAGVTIKFKGKNSNRSLIGLENCTIKEDGKKSVMTCNLYLLIFNNKYEALEKAGIEYEKCWSGAPMLKGIEVSEAVDIVEKLKDDMDKLVGGIDKKLGDNRQKMEDNLKKDKKTSAKVSSKKTEESDEEEEKPKKTVKTSSKKTVKKK